jgi:hypothetical protein
MTRRETNAIVQHFNPLPPADVLNELAEWVRDGHPAAGRIHQVTCERRTAASDRAGVLGHLARDVELLAAIAGDIRRVSAIGPATLDSSFASLQVQIATTAASSARWSVSSAAYGTAGMQVALLGERGMVYLREFTGANNAPQWELETSADSLTAGEELETADPASNAITRIVDAISQQDPNARGNCSTWSAATRDMEVIDAVELSLQKGRTIEVFQQQLTEQLAFRGTMAALGCGLLLVAFFGVIAIALLGGAEGVIRQRIAPAWPLVLLAVLAFFLLLQAVPLLAQKSRNAGDADSTAEKNAEAR